MRVDHLDLVRSLTDEQVLRALMEHRRLTRAELATTIGISKPTAGESVRRLSERGLLVDTGERTPGGRGKGRVGSYYGLSATAGTALAVSIAPAGVTVEGIDAYGDTTAHVSHAIEHPARVAETLRATARAAGGHPRLAVVSVADPVDRATGRLVELPDAPFLVGALDPVAELAPLVDGPVVVDNDVNWAARAERDRATPGERDNFAHLFLGEGLGCAIVSDGEITRGHRGLAGEVAHLITIGPGGRAVAFTEIFAELGLRRPGSTAIDAGRLLGATDAREPLARAVGGVIAAIVALADPARVVVGGSWGPALVADIRAAVAGMPRAVPVEPASGGRDADLAGARQDALHRLRAAIVTGSPAPASSTRTPDAVTTISAGGVPGR